MAKIFIRLNMFAVNQDISFVDENNNLKQFASVPTDKVAEFASSFAVINNIEEIELNGNISFAQQIIYDLNEIFKTEYYNRNVRILLNGEVCSK